MSSGETKSAAMPRFGTVFCQKMGIARYRAGAWEPFAVQPTAPLSLHPASHVLHYASTIFEGFKAYRWDDGSVRVFRIDRHMRRMRESAEAMCLPFPGEEVLRDAVMQLVDAVRADIPALPASLYLRPCLIGTSPDIGAAAQPTSEACLFILASPVGDYFSGGLRPLRLLVAEGSMRTTPQMGRVKTGGNYAAALRLTLDARRQHAVDQVLFCPGGDVQETGAANFIMMNDERVLTKELDPAFLHGVTRDSLLILAADLGYQVEERSFHVSEMLEWARTGEAALSGTAAVLSPVGSLVYRGQDYLLGDGQVGANATRLRKALGDIQSGKAEDRHGWLSMV